MSKSCYSYPTSIIRQRLFTVRRNIQRCRAYLNMINVDLVIVNLEIDTIWFETWCIDNSSLRPEAEGDAHDAQHLHGLRELLVDLRDWHQMVLAHSEQELEHLQMMMVNRHSHRYHP